MPSLARYATIFTVYSIFQSIRLGLTYGRLDDGVMLNSKEMRPILTLGCPHSGTTLMQRLVSAHPGIHGIRTETEFLIRNRNSPEGLRAAYEGFQRQAYAKNLTRWAEKTPPHICYLDRAFELFPKARVIMMLRDGRDVVYSHERRHIKDKLTKAWGADPTLYATRTWRSAFRCGLKYYEDPRVRLVRYERLVADPMATMSSVFEFIGEEATYEAVHAYQLVDKEGFGNMQIRREQTSKPLYDGGGQWKNWDCEKRKHIENSYPEFISLLYAIGYSGLEC